MADRGKACILYDYDKRERAHLYRWVAGEEDYVEAKFDGQRDGHDVSLKETGLNGWWMRQITQYLDRARILLQEAQSVREDGDTVDARHMEQAAQQALAKAMMTVKGCVESSIRVYGALPKPGLSSGNVEDWEPDPV